jgi:hypothetical protein
MARAQADKSNCVRNGTFLWLHLFSTKAAFIGWIIQKELSLYKYNESLQGGSYNDSIG